MEFADEWWKIIQSYCLLFDSHNYCDSIAMGITLYIINEQVLFSIGLDATKFLNSGVFCTHKDKVVRQKCSLTVIFGSMITNKQYSNNNVFSTQQKQLMWVCFAL